MNSSENPRILSVDDDPDSLRLIERYLSGCGYDIQTAEGGASVFNLLKGSKPDLILMDILMPEMNGYEVCAKLKEDKDLGYIPVIFVTTLGEEQDRAKAFSVGAVDYIVKPIQRDILVRKVKAHLATNSRWKDLRDTLWRDLKQGTSPKQGKITPVVLAAFKRFLTERFTLPPADQKKLTAIAPAELYLAASLLGISKAQLAKHLAEFLDRTYLPHVNPNDVRLGVLPTPFCKANLVVALSDSSDRNTFVVSNPFNWDLMELLEKIAGTGPPAQWMLTAPENIQALFDYDASTPVTKISLMRDTRKMAKSAGETVRMAAESDTVKHPTLPLANSVLDAAVSERASDIHIEPKENDTIIRFRIDGDMREYLTLKTPSGIMLISRFKALAGLDIAEKRKPQDGALEVSIDNRTFQLRLATTSTPHGESLIMRLLEPTAKPKELKELGMTAAQGNTLIDLVNHPQGLILIAGPTGSGKTTTVYSLLSQIDRKTRSMISVEDPIEYRLPFANQQQVNEKAGISFESLLKSSVRQDPDILFVGEVRDPVSAKISIDFASTGHVTITTLHTSNATTAIFRLERLGIKRETMAETILAVVAQRLLKKLCTDCKEIGPPSQQEIELLAPYAQETPTEVAHPVGCPKCNNTGYRGREGIYEVLKFDHEIADRIRSDVPISEIREFLRRRGDYLISHHAVEKVVQLIFSPTDVYEKVLVEEPKPKAEATQPRETRVTTIEKSKRRSTVLVVEDDKDTQALIQLLLTNVGYEIDCVEDGMDALFSIARKEYDLILLDINIPNLDGFKLMEMKNQKGVKSPVIFLTARTSDEDEMKGLELGAVDYIRKPIKKETFLARIKKVLEQSPV